MPHGMPVSHSLVCRIKDDTTRIEETSREEPPEAGRSDAIDQWLRGNCRKPAHRYIRHCGKSRATEPAKCFHCDADNRHCPDDGEERVAKPTAQWPEHERCVAAGDQNVDRGVIDHAKETSRGRLRKGVVDSRRCIQKNERHSENRRARNVEGISALERGNHQKGQGHQACSEPDTMCDAVRYPLAEGVSLYRVASWFHRWKYTHAAQPGAKSGSLPGGEIVIIVNRGASWRVSCA